MTLQEIKARAEAATEGPWEVEAMDAGHSRYEMNVWVDTANGDSICDMNGLTRSRNEKFDDDGYVDAKFIAHARTDVPKLVGALEAVQGLVGWLDAAENMHPGQKVVARVVAERLRAITETLEEEA